MFLNLLFILLCAIDAKIIKNIDIPICRNCVYYKPEYYTDFSSEVSKCVFFGTKNIQTGVINTDFASLCRENEDKCGVEGKYFEEDTNVELKIWLHNIIRTLPFNMSLLFIFINIYIENVKPK